MKLFQGTGERPCLLDTMFSHGQRDCSYSYSEGQILVWWLQELRMSVGSEHASPFCYHHDFSIYESR